MSHPKQIILGGVLAGVVWHEYLLPLVANKKLSTRFLAKRLGISHNTVSLWRRAHVK